MVLPLFFLKDHMWGSSNPSLCVSVCVASFYFVPAIAPAPDFGVLQTIKIFYHAWMVRAHVLHLIKSRDFERRGLTFYE